MLKNKTTNRSLIYRMFVAFLVIVLFTILPGCNSKKTSDSDILSVKSIILEEGESMLTVSDDNSAELVSYDGRKSSIDLMRDFGFDLSSFVEKIDNNSDYQFYKTDLYTPEAKKSEEFIVFPISVHHKTYIKVPYEIVYISLGLEYKYIDRHIIYIIKSEEDTCLLLRDSDSR
jgi:hypothetical protein